MYSTMNVQIALLFCSLALVTAHQSNDTRIVGGKSAAPGQFPYQVSIRNYGRHYCGGSIVSSMIVLTAAHCVKPLLGLDIATGTISSTNSPPAYTYRASAFVPHPFFNGTTLENDIAMIKLRRPIRFDNLVQPIGLPSSNIPDNTEAVASGWGYTSYPGQVSQNLQYLNLKVISKDECKKSHNGYLFDSQICTLNKAGEGVCSGDSGGPLVQNGKLHGVTSAAYLCALGLPDFFTRVYSYIGWIAAHM